MKTIYIFFLCLMFSLPLLAEASTRIQDMPASATKQQEDTTYESTDEEEKRKAKKKRRRRHKRARQHKTSTSLNSTR